MNEWTLDAGYDDLDPLEGITHRRDKIDDRARMGNNHRSRDLDETLGDREFVEIARAESQSG